MHRLKTLARSETLTSVVLLLVISALMYLPFIGQFGYYKDDWYLMYSAGTKGSQVFHAIFAIDRPLRALVMIPAYTLFGPNPLYYNLSAYFFRLAGALGFLWTLSILWPRQRWANLGAALLFLIYPGFLSQPNAIDYQSHIAGLAAGMLSIALTLRAIISNRVFEKIVYFVFSIILGWFYLGQIEWYIGLEVFRWACVLILFFQQGHGLWKAGVLSLWKAFPALLVAAGFLIWRLRFFESERGATDVGLQLGEFRSAPLTFLLNWLGTLVNDVFDSVLYAWVTPLRRLSPAVEPKEWVLGVLITVFVLGVWGVFQSRQSPENTQARDTRTWIWQAAILGFTLILFGLLPVVLVGRSVDFKNFSRYTIIASAGVALLWQVGIRLAPNLLIQRILFGALLVSASLTHFVNARAHIQETETLQSFWWQVSWRIPQMEQGTTLAANYATVAIEEDYFVWGPASLIFYPDSLHADYPQPGIYSVVITDETIAKIQAREPQEFSERRSIRTYPNYRNVLILTQPSPGSCVQVIDGLQPEISSYEEERVKAIASFSEVGQMITQGDFLRPAQIPFGDEPEHGWCYYYEKAAYARQTGDWEQVVSLGEQAFGNGFMPTDEIEWMPFLQAYARIGDLARLRELGAYITDASIQEQACRILGTTAGLTPETQSEAHSLFCQE